MVKVFLFCSSVWFMQLAMNHTKPQYHLICWNEKRELTWDDFSGIPDTTIYTYYGDTADVVSVLSVFVDLDSSNNYFVKAIFDTRSWYEQGKNKTLALNHEQSHFNLTEVYARRLRKRIREEEYSDKFDINKVYQEVMGDLNKSSNEYDVATAHGAIELAQDNWSSKINKQLKEMDDYKDNSEFCPCNI